MRKLLLVLAVVFAASLYTAGGVEAAKSPTKKKTSAVTTKHKAVKPASKVVCKPKTTLKRTAKPARYARGPKAIKRKAVKSHCKLVCKPKKMVRRHATPARYARGPVVTCPAPVVNVPEQPAPVVNVPQQPAPVVNVPPSPPTVGITTDQCSIYIVRGDQLMILDKNTYCVKKVVPLQ